MAIEPDTNPHLRTYVLARAMLKVLTERLGPEFAQDVLAVVRVRGAPSATADEGTIRRSLAARELAEQGFWDNLTRPRPDS